MGDSVDAESDFENLQAVVISAIELDPPPTIVKVKEEVFVQVCVLQWNKNSMSH